MDFLANLLEASNTMSQYPFIEKLVLLAVTLVFAAMQVKKRFKDITGSLGLVTREMATARKEMTDGMTEMKNEMSGLNKSLQEHIVQTDLRMSEGEQRFTTINIEIEKINMRLDQITKTQGG